MPCRTGMLSQRESVSKAVEPRLPSRQQDRSAEPGICNRWSMDLKIVTETSMARKITALLSHVNSFVY